MYLFLRIFGCSMLWLGEMQHLCILLNTDISWDNLEKCVMLVTKSTFRKEWVKAREGGEEHTMPATFHLACRVHSPLSARLNPFFPAGKGKFSLLSL